MSGEGERTIEEIFGADPARLIGRTIVGAEAEEKYERVRNLRLTLDTGETVRIGHWASYADDSGLEMDLEVHDPALPKPPVVFFDEEPAHATRMLLPDIGTAGNQREQEENENPQIEANRALERNTREQE
jgi:hypothetical protein